MEVVIVGLLSWGVYALLAVGFCLIYGVARILNLAHTAFYMLAAYFLFIGVHYFFLNLLLATVIAVLATIFLGIIYYVFILDLIREHEATVLIVTVATALIIQESIKLTFTERFRAVPAVFSGFVEILGVSISSQYLLTLFAASVFLFVVWIWLSKTKVGTAVRCTAQDRETAGLMGINVGRVCLLTTVVSVALSAVCGIIVAPIWVVEPGMWMHPLVVVLAVVVLGGLGSIKGSIAGAFILAFTETLVVFLVPEGAFFKGPIAMVVMIAVLLIKPEGLFGVVFEEERL